MTTEREYIQTNHRPFGQTGKIMTGYFAQKLLEINREKHSHLLVVMDTFDYETYPVQVPKGCLADYISRYSKDMQKVLEVVELEPTNERIAAFLKGNKPNSFKDFSGRDLD